MPLVTCPDCSNQVSDAAPACPKCGRPMRSGAVMQPTWNPGIAAVLSLVLPGAGQMYRGDIGVGFRWLALVAVLYFFSLIVGATVHGLCLGEAAVGVFRDASGKRSGAPVGRGSDVWGKPALLVLAVIFVAVVVAQYIAYQDRTRAVQERAMRTPVVIGDTALPPMAPAPRPALSLTKDQIAARIDSKAIPQEGEKGLTARDVEIIRAGIEKYVGNGECLHATAAGKSADRPDTYFVNCGIAKDIPFTAGDVGKGS